MKKNKSLIIWFIAVFIFFMITKRTDYEGNAKRLAEEECVLVVEIPPSHFTSVTFQAEGYNPINKKKCECRHYNRWWSSYKNEIQIGDTIVKKKGQLVFSIHKKDSIISHQYKL